ncbi:MAG: hypothetical protein JXQ65_02015 [Candidatus Marinimicrobia bacterium]|nr:hypothetical protein [Candidatus Neomarinimicrobiota bacterium]
MAKKIILVMISIVMFLSAQDKPIEIKIFTGLQNQMSSNITSERKGWLSGGEIGYKWTDKLSTNLRVGFEYMTLEEDTVLLEWNWAYWDQRYIDWMLTGATQEEVDSISTIKEYWRSDSSYHGIFNPHQWVQELSFSLNMKYKQPITEKFSLFGSFGMGFNLYERRLKMVEDWWKTFSWQWDSTGIAEGSYEGIDLDNYYTLKELHEENPDDYEFIKIVDGEKVTYKYIYDYYTRVTHFAPDRYGTVFFMTPELGISYAIADWVDLEASYRGQWYFTGESIEGVENLFNVRKNSRKWFPFESKSMVTIGLTFKY